MNQSTTTNTKDITTNIIVGKTLADCQVSFTFGDGSVPIIVNLGMLENEIHRYAALHGLKQKIGDAGAISRNPDTGKSATIADKRAAMYEVFARITDPTNPQWNKTREGGAGPRYGLLLTALTRLYPAKSIDELKTYLDGKAPAQKTALRDNPKIAKIIGEIKLERAGAVDTDSMLNELED